MFLILQSMENFAAWELHGVHSEETRSTTDRSLTGRDQDQEKKLLERLHVSNPYVSTVSTDIT